MTTFTITHPMATITHALATLKANLKSPVRVCSVLNGVDRATGMVTLRLTLGTVPHGSAF